MSCLNLIYNGITMITVGRMLLNFLSDYQQLHMTMKYSLLLNAIVEKYFESLILHCLPQGEFLSFFCFVKWVLVHFSLGSALPLLCGFGRGEGSYTDIVDSSTLRFDSVGQSRVVLSHANGHLVANF